MCRKITASMALTLFLLILLSLPMAVTATQPDIQESFGYDPFSDATKELLIAQNVAKTSHRNILLIAGGPWCIQCRKFDAYIKKNPDLQALIDSRFVMLKVYFGELNENEEFFSRFQKAFGYPYFWLLHHSGDTLASASILDFRGNEDAIYNKPKLIEFLTSYAANIESAPAT